MNFISLRDQIHNWTLNSDDKLYRAIKELSDTMFEAQTNIQKSIQSTRYEVLKGGIEAGSGFNQYLRISENKFTENKIGERIQKEAVKENQIQNEPKNKMDMFAEALDLGIKNLEIQEDKNTDLVSVSDMSSSALTLSHSIFKEGKMPVYFGTTKFASIPYLGLFQQGELEASIMQEQFQVNDLIIPNRNSMANQESVNGQIFNQNVPGNYSNPNLAPPPSLEAVLNNNQYQNVSPASQSGLPPPPPPPKFDLPPPPPLLTTNSLPPPPTGQLLLPPPPPPPPSFNNFSQNSPVIENKPAEEYSPEKKTKKSLTMQEQMLLRLKHGKNYTQMIKEEQEEVCAPYQQKESEVTITVAMRESVSSRNANQIIRESFGGLNNKVFEAPGDIKPPHQKESSIVQDEEVDAIFGPSKNKNRENTQALKNIKLDDEIMRRTTFNEDLLIKKKSPLLEKAAEKKPVNKPLFGKNSSDEEENDFDFSDRSKFKKKSPLQVPEKKSPIQSPKKKKAFSSDSEQQQKITSKKPNPINPMFKKKEVAQIVQIKHEEPEEIKIEEVIVESTSENKKLSTIIQRDSHVSSSSSYVQNVAKAGGAGMPLFPPGMVFTKPSAAKKQEAEALQKLKREEEQKKLYNEKIALQKAEQEERERQIAEQIKKAKAKQIQIENQRKLAQKISQPPIFEQKIEASKPPIKAEPIKPAPKKKNLFDDDDEDDDDFFKKAKKVVPPPPVLKQIESQQDETKIRSTQQQEKDKIIQVRTSDQVSVNNLTTRRKKAKANLLKEEGDSLFDSILQVQQKPAPILNNIESQSIHTNYANPLLGRESVQSSASSYAQKVAEASGMRAMPLIPKGMVFGKPSQTKKNQDEALEKSKRQQEQMKKRKAEEQKIQKEQERARIQQIERLQQQKLQQEQIERQQQLRRIQQQKKQEEQMMKRQLQRKRQEERVRLQKIERDRLENERKERQRREQEQQNRRRIEEQRKIAEQQQKRAKEQKQKEEAAKLAEKKMPFIPKIQSKGTQSKNPLGLPSIPKITEKKSGGNPLGISSKPKTNPLGGLGSSSMKREEPPKVVKKNNPLFGEKQDDDDFAIKPTSKPITQPLTKKRNLFDDEDDDNDFLTKKTQPKVTQAASITKKVQLEPQIKVQPALKPLPSKKRNLFDDDDEDDSGFMSKKPVKSPIHQQQPEIVHKPVVQLQKKKALFGGSDDQDDFMSKKPAVKVPPPKIEQKPTKKKNLLFDDDDDDDFTFKKPNPIQSKPVPTKAANILLDSDSDESMTEKMRMKEARKKIKGLM